MIYKLIFLIKDTDDNPTSILKQHIVSNYPNGSSPIRLYNIM